MFGQHSGVSPALVRKEISVNSVPLVILLFQVSVCFMKNRAALAISFDCYLKI